MQRQLCAVVFGLGTFAASPVAAQWETPTFFSPSPGEDLGVYFWDPPGSVLNWGVGAIWRQEGNLSLGVRLGYSEGEVFHVGGEFYGPLALAPQSQLLFSWLLGLGASFNGQTWMRVPAGVSMGLNLGTPGGLQFKPYVFPRVAFDLFAFDDGEEEVTETEFNADVDIGADAALGQSFVLRVGFTLGLTDRGANTIGAGIAYRMPRRVAVR